MGNRWCEELGIAVPALASVMSHREAKPYSLMIVALLERGEAMTLAEVADRFEAAGVAPAERALRSLQRCKPGRAPVIRDGERYHLDPHDDELNLWVFRLGLRPPRAPRLRVVPPSPPPRPEPGTPLSREELHLAWKDANLTSWSQRRLVLAVLDAVRRPLEPAAVVRFVTERARWVRLDADPRKFRQSGSPVAVLEDGRWSIDPSAREALLKVREAVRDRVDTVRFHASQRPDPAVWAAQKKAAERRREARAAELAALRRALLVAYPPTAPRAVALVDVSAHRIETFVDDELSALSARLEPFDLLGAMDIRAVLRGLGIDASPYRLAELSPPQRTRQLNKRGRTLKITMELLVRGSCGISRPFGDPKKLAGYLAKGQHGRLRRRLEADAKSLHALYQYSRLHRSVRLCWGFLDERIRAPWVQDDEPTLRALMEEADARGDALDVVVGSAPGWSDPWSRAYTVWVHKEPSGWGRLQLVDVEGFLVDDADVQAARLSSGGLTM